MLRSLHVRERSVWVDRSGCCHSIGKLSGNVLKGQVHLQLWRGVKPKAWSTFEGAKLCH